VIEQTTWQPLGGFFIAGSFNCVEFLLWGVLFARCYHRSAFTSQGVIIAWQVLFVGCLYRWEFIIVRSLHCRSLHCRYLSSHGYFHFLIAGVYHHGDEFCSLGVIVAWSLSLPGVFHLLIAGSIAIRAFMIMGGVLLVRHYYCLEFVIIGSLSLRRVNHRWGGVFHLPEFFIC